MYVLVCKQCELHVVSAGVKYWPPIATGPLQSYTSLSASVISSVLPVMTIPDPAASWWGLTCSCAYSAHIWQISSVHFQIDISPFECGDPTLLVHTP